MYNIRPNPKKVKWNLRVQTVNDVKHFVTGYYSPVLDRNTVEQENIVFDAQISIEDMGRGRSAVTYRFVDEQGNKFYTGVSGMFEITKAVQKGILQVVNGSFKGTFTFAKQGSEVYLMPYIE